MTIEYLEEKHVKKVVKFLKKAASQNAMLFSHLSDINKITCLKKTCDHCGEVNVIEEDEKFWYICVVCGHLLNQDCYLAQWVDCDERLPISIQRSMYMSAKFYVVKVSGYTAYHSAMFLDGEWWTSYFSKIVDPVVCWLETNR